MDSTKEGSEVLYYNGHKHLPVRETNPWAAALLPNGLSHGTHFFEHKFESFVESVKTLRDYTSDNLKIELMIESNPHGDMRCTEEIQDA